MFEDETYAAYTTHHRRALDRRIVYDVQLKQDCGLTIAQYGLLSGCAVLFALR